MNIRFPSVARIERDLNTDEDTAKRIRGLMDGSIDPDTSEAVQSWIRQCLTLPTTNHDDQRRKILLALDEAYETCGIEYIVRQSDQELFAEYYNTGDTYCATILYCYRVHRFMLMSWGDYVENHGL